MAHGKPDKNKQNKLTTPADAGKAREVAISKALSYVLRHAAEREGLKMDAQGYANVADVLAWRKLKSQKATFEEIIQAVAISDKKRFALLHIPSAEAEANEKKQPNVPRMACSAERVPNAATEPSTTEEQAAQERTTTTTKQALLAFESDQTPTNYLIRATQGHSIKTIDTTALLQPLALSEPSTLPTTVVHGTYHAAWPAILASGGLHCMGRTHVHFATGPALSSVLPGVGADGTDSVMQGTKELGLNDGQVISGMRKDAQVLIYVDVRRALGAGVPFWRSENGVILSEGIDIDISGYGEAGSKWDKRESVKVVPLEFFDVVVERKHGVGILWEGGKVVKELPESWTKRGNPKGRSNVSKGKKPE